MRASKPSCATVRRRAPGRAAPGLQRKWCLRTRRFRSGIAHSVETWIDGSLAGGLYGVAIGRMFYGESMFTRVTDASKIALVFLVRQIARWGYELIDCQMATAHLASFGAREIPRAGFLRMVQELVNYPRDTGEWRVDNDLFD